MTDTKRKISTMPDALERPKRPKTQLKRKKKRAISPRQVQDGEPKRDLDGVSFHIDISVTIPPPSPSSGNKIEFRARTGYHSRVGYTPAEYAKFQDEKYAHHKAMRSISDRIVNLEHARELSVDDVHVRNFFWPATGSKLVAPYTKHHHTVWKHRRNNKKNTFVRFLGNPAYAALVLPYVFQTGHFATAHLAATCQRLFDIVSGYPDRWDLSFGDLNFCDRDPKANNASMHLGSILTVVSLRIFSADHDHIMGREHRNGQTMDAKMSMAKYRDLFINARVDARISSDNDGKPIFNLETARQSDHRPIWKFSYYENMRNNLRMLRAINQFGSNLRVLQLHRVKLFDIRGVAILLEGCPNLQSMGIYQCEMLHFGHIINLLDMIHRFNLAHKRGKAAGLGLDYYPRYHRGPLFFRQEEFGISWNNEGFTPVQQGIFQIWLSAFLKAERLNIDIMSRGTAFRKYLEDLPLQDNSVPDFIDAVMTWIHWFERLGSRPGLLSLQQKLVLKHDICAVVLRGLENAHWQSFRRTALKLDNINGFLDKSFCRSCGVVMCNVFFPSEALSQQPNQRICAGCLLRKNLDFEMDHHKINKRNILDKTFGQQTRHIVVHELTEAPFIKNDIFTTTTRRQGLPNGLIYKRDYKVYVDIEKGMSSLSDVVRSNREFAHWGESMLEAMDLDMKDRMQQHTRGQHCDDWRTPQPVRDNSTGRLEQVSWETLLKLRQDREYQELPVSTFW